MLLIFNKNTKTYLKLIVFIEKIKALSIIGVQKKMFKKSYQKV
jgi:hypothetical protein